MGLRVDVDNGIVLLVARPYDETIIDCIRKLPDRRYRHKSQDWIMPARRTNRRALNCVIAELEERGIDTGLSEAAAAILARIDVGRAMLSDGQIEIAGPYSQRRLPALRDLPERRLDAERKTWTVALTRAGALALLALADTTDELVTTHRARAVLQRVAASAASERHDPSGVDPARGPARRSPIAHWRHHTAGPVFDNPSVSACTLGDRPHTHGLLSGHGTLRHAPSWIRTDDPPSPIPASRGATSITIDVAVRLHAEGVRRVGGVSGDGWPPELRTAQQVVRGCRLEGPPFFGLTQRLCCTSSECEVGRCLAGFSRRYVRLSRQMPADTHGVVPRCCSAGVSRLARRRTARTSSRRPGCRRRRG